MQRPAKFVKYLSRFGWEITVVTTQASLCRELHGVQDPALLREIPAGVVIRRIESAERPLEPPRGALGRGRLDFERRLATLAPVDLARRWPEPARLLRRWWWARRAADPSQGWAERVAGELAVRGERWPLILATAPPCSSLLAAQTLARRWRVPFVADLRDPWCAGNRALSVRLFGHRRLEGSVLREAARTIVVTAGMRELYERAWPACSGRLEVIENGVDLEEPPWREPCRPASDRFDVVYTGVLTEDRSPEPFFRAAGLAIAQSPEFARDLRIIIAGRIGTTRFLARRHRAMAKEAGLREHLEEPGYLPHDEVIRLQRSAGLLLTIVAGGTHIASGKSYEYVAAGRPILALTEPGGAATEVLRRAPVVVFPRFDDPESIAGELLRLHARWRRREFETLGPHVPEPYTREYQARQLDHLLRTVLAEAGGSTPANLRAPARRHPIAANPEPAALTRAPSPSRMPYEFRLAMKETIRRLSRLLQPLARRWARPGYFSPSPGGIPPRSIAVIACHWIGDTLWASQVLPALQAAWPEAEITVITKPGCVDLWCGLVRGDRIVPAPEITSDRHREGSDWRGLFRRAASLRARRFELVIDLTGDRYSALFTFLLRPGWGLGFAGDELGWLYSAGGGKEPAARAHLRTRPFEVVGRALPGLAPPTRVRPPRPSLPFADASRAHGLDPTRPVVVLAPGAGWPEKRWPESVFAGLAELLAAKGMQVAIVGSSRERELCERLRAGTPGGMAVAVAGAPLGEVCGLLSEAAAVIGNDSGIVHLAAAYGRPALALFTDATDPARCGPVGDRALVLGSHDSKADPASITAWVLAERARGPRSG